jgi:hypothetical protein
MTGWFDERPGSADDAGSPRDDAFDARWLDQLLEAPDPVSVPAEYRALANVLVAARAPGTDFELAGEALAVDGFRSSCGGRGRATDRPAPRRAAHRMRAVVVGVVLGALTATGVAAAAGSLPADVQNIASEVLAKIGIHVPVGDRPAPPQVVDSDNAGGRAPIGTAPDPTGQAGPIAKRPARDGPAAVFSPQVAATPLVGLIDAVTGLAPTPTLGEATATGAPMTAPDPQPVVLPSAAEEPAPDGSGPGHSPSPVANTSQSMSDATDASPIAGGPPASVPASPNASPNAGGPPAAVPASPNASPNAGGPPASVPASSNASPNAGDPPAAVPASPNASPNVGGPPASVPASPNASPKAGSPPISATTGATLEDDPADP